MKKILILVLLLAPTSVFANWTLNVGYHNPVGATYGLNFLYFGTHWAFEIGAGWVDVKSDLEEDDDDPDKNDDGKVNEDDDIDHVAFGGDLDVKYLFRSGVFRPYLQGGLGWGASRSIGEAGPHGGVGGAFVGAGILLGKPDFYVYGAFVTSNLASRGLQAGIGFDI